MYQIIHFGTCTYHRIGTYAPVDGTVGPNLHPIFNHYPAATVHFLVMNIPVRLFVIIKSITAYDCSCLDNNIITDNTMIKNGHIRMDDTILTDSYLVTDISTGHYHRAFTYHRRVADHFHRRCKWPVKVYNLQVSFKRLFHNQQCFPIRNIGFFIYDNKTGG